MSLTYTSTALGGTYNSPYPLLGTGGGQGGGGGVGSLTSGMGSMGGIVSLHTTSNQ